MKTRNTNKSTIVKVKKQFNTLTDTGATQFFDDETMQNLIRLGIQGCTSKLKDTPFSPQACMKSVKRTLDFCGVTGAKWVEKESPREDFETMLKSMTAKPNSKVRFLLINPNGKEFNHMKELRKGEFGGNSYPYWQQLIEKYKSVLEVRCYDHLPAFRLQFVDNNILAVSRYHFIHDEYRKTDKGWETPHLIINACSESADMSLYDVFESYFVSEWKKAKDLSKINL